MGRFRVLTVLAVAAIIAATALIAGILIGDRLSQQQSGRTELTSTATPTPLPGAGEGKDGASPVATVTPLPGKGSNAGPVKDGQPATAFSAAGAVYDLTGAPLAGASVSFVFDGYPEGRVTVQTSEGGRYRAVNLPSATASVISAEFAGHTAAEVHGVSLPIDGLDLYLEPLAGLTIAVLEVATTGEAPRPFSGSLDLFVAQRHEPGTTNPMGIAQVGVREGQFITVQTHHLNLVDGKTLISNLKPGITRVCAVAGGRYAETEPFKVEPAGRGEANLVLGITGQIAGQVLSVSTSAPLSGAIAVARHVSSPEGVELAINLQKSALTDGSGRFSLSELAPGTYLLTLGADGYSTKTVEELRVSQDGQGPPDTSYVLIEGTAGVEVSLVGPDGRPLANTPGVLGATGGPDGRTYFGRSDAAGLLRFMPVVAGRYVLAVTLPGGASRQKTVEVVVAEGIVSRTRLEFLPTFQVSGLATSGGTPYEGLLSFSKRGAAVAEQYARTDASGAFTVELESGEYMVSRPGDARALQVEVRSGVSRLLELKFP